MASFQLVGIKQASHHSVPDDDFGSRPAFRTNADLQHARPRDRYAFQSLACKA